MNVYRTSVEIRQEYRPSPKTTSTYPPLSQPMTTIKMLPSLRPTPHQFVPMFRLKLSLRTVHPTLRPFQRLLRPLKLPTTRPLQGDPTKRPRKILHSQRKWFDRRKSPQNPVLLFVPPHDDQLTTPKCLGKNLIVPARFPHFILPYLTVGAGRGPQGIRRWEERGVEHECTIDANTIRFDPP